MPRRKSVKPKEDTPSQDAGLKDVLDGPLRNRSYGLRVDDDVEISIIAGNDLIKVQGRVLSTKDELEIVDIEGFYHKITVDWIVDIKILCHNRPLPELDPEMVKKTVKPKLKKASVDHAYY